MKFQCGNFSELFNDWKKLDGQYPWDAFASIFLVHNIINIKSKFSKIGFEILITISSLVIIFFSEFFPKALKHCWGEKRGRKAWKFNY